MRLGRKLAWTAAAVVVLGGVTTGAAVVAFGSTHRDKVADSNTAKAGGQQDDSIFAQSGEAQADVAPAASAAASTPAGASSMRPGSKLVSGQSLRSPNGRYTLLAQPDGNFVEYDSAKKAVWSAQTYNHSGAYLIFQTDGNVVVYTGNTPLWNSGTSGTRAGALLTLQNDGNLVLTTANGTAVWNGLQEAYTLFPWQGLLTSQQRMSPNGKYKLQQQPDGNLVEYSGSTVIWASQTSGHSGAHAYLGGDGNLVVYAPNKSPLYSTATWQTANSYVVVQNDGNVVVTRPDKTAAWGTLSQGVSMLVSGQSLTAGQSRTSANGKYRLLQQPDGNLVEYNASNAPVWSTKTYGQAGASVKLQADGNLVIYTTASKAIWNSATTGKGAAYLLIQDDGNVVLYTAAQKAIWSNGV